MSRDGETRAADASSDYTREWTEVGAAERQHVFGDRERPGLGLAISGGGIRSASFGLGVLQALVAHGDLARVDYLSTVSGGGYIGSSLTWFLKCGLPTRPPWRPWCCAPLRSPCWSTAVS